MAESAVGVETAIPGGETETELGPDGTDDAVVSEVGEVVEVGWPARAAARAGVDERPRRRTSEPARLIVEAAQRLVSEKGSSFTIQGLAREAGFSLQTFYRYFAGKEELLLAVIEQRIADACVEFETHGRTFSRSDQSSAVLCHQHLGQPG